MADVGGVGEGGRPEGFDWLDLPPVRRELRGLELPASLEDLVAEYERVTGDRDRFLWAWVHALAPSFTLPSVERRSREDSALLKTKLTMFVVLLDDLVDKHGDLATFEEATAIPRRGEHPDPDRPAVDEAYLAFAAEVWDSVRADLEAAPRRDEFAALLRADVVRVTDAIEYADRVNRRPATVSLADLEAHTADNMAMLAYATMDLMVSPGFAAHDLLPVRNVVRVCQEMARIGNWVTTWERELAEGDFTSGVVIAALEDGVVSRAALDRLRDGADQETLRRVSAAIDDAGIERRLLADWRAKRERALELADRPESVDMASYVRGMEDVLAYHLAGRDMK